MVSHNADVDYEDDDESLEDHRYNSRRRSPQSHSRPSSPPLPPTTATILHHPSSLSVTPSSHLSSSTSRTDGGTSSSIASPSQTNTGSSSNSTGDHHTSLSHALSPFAFFSHGSHNPNGEHHSTKTLKIELAHPEIVLMTGQTTMLEGVVYVNLHKTSKVKSLNLEFSGRSSVTWVDGKTKKNNPCIHYFLFPCLFTLCCSQKKRRLSLSF
jgi:hypothetical protein